MDPEQQMTVIEIVITWLPFLAALGVWGWWKQRNEDAG